VKDKAGVSTATQLIRFKNGKVNAIEIGINSALKRSSDLLQDLFYDFDSNALDSFNGFDQNCLAYPTV
jgi:hypothetical protein